MTKIFASSLMVLVTVFGSSCSSDPKPKVVPIGDDTFMISREAKVMGWGNLPRMKEEVYREAIAFAERQGKAMVPVSTNEAPVAFGKYAFFELKFRLVSKDDPEIADRPQDETDLYIELTKLDELRKKGLITDAEFEAQKKKLLERKQ